MTVLHCRGKSQTQETPDGGKKEKCRISCKGKSVFMFQDKNIGLFNSPIFNNLN